MKSILITGASRGVGRALAVKCAKSGAFNKIIINCRQNEAELNKTAALIAEVCDVQCIRSIGDIGDPDYVRSLRELCGPVNVLINNAAISLTGLLIDMTDSEWNDIISTNITSLFNTCHTFAPDMIRQGEGHIINVSSVWGLRGASCEVAYSTTKGAVNAFTMALAKELAPSHVQVNAAALGIVDTEMNSHLSEEELSEIREDIPAGYIATASEAAEFIYKMIDMPKYLTGEVIKFDGGWQ